MIKLNVKHTKLNASCLETLVAGNVNSIFAEFSFSPEWDGLSRVAVFSNGTATLSVPLSENSCAIPWEVLNAPGELTVAVRGIGSGGTVLCTENASLGKVTDTLADDDGDTPGDATPGVIDSLISDVADLISGGVPSGGGGADGADGKSAYELALDAGFVGTLEQWLQSLHGADGVDGSDGVDGTNGTNGVDGYTPVKGTDYFTAADKAEIVSAVVDEIGVPETEVFTAIYGQTSYNDILAAYNAGKKIQVVRTTSDSKYIYDISYIYSANIRFGQITNTRFYSCSVTSNNEWSYEAVLYSDFYVKPSGGIPASDLSSSAITTIVNRVLSELQS